MSDANSPPKTKRQRDQRQYYLDHRDEFLARSRTNYSENREARLAQNKRKYHEDHVGVILDRVRQRCRTKGIEFGLTRADIVVPKNCPVLGIPLARAYGGKALRNSPSVDRIDPTKGYVPGNIQIISYQANVMKSNASAGDLLKFAEWVIAMFGTPQTALLFNVAGAEHVRRRQSV